MVAPALTLEGDADAELALVLDAMTKMVPWEETVHTIGLMLVRVRFVAYSPNGKAIVQHYRLWTVDERRRFQPVWRSCEPVPVDDLLELRRVLRCELKRYCALRRTLGENP